jgi:Response regulator containing CheY-like receiver, AAA-type ATPase, and DNA-binding domains
MPHILLVDDEPAQRQAMRKLLESDDNKVAEAGSVSEANERYQFGDFDLIITELKLPGDAGTEFIQLANPVPVVVTTQYASLRSAVDSMKAGAVDYLAKPCSADDLLAVVREAIADHPMAHSAGPHKGSNKGSMFEGNCPAIRRLHTNIEKVAATHSTVLILGETGTGKEVTARSVHKLSQRADRRMIAALLGGPCQNCISQIYVVEKEGAFTGANTNRVGLIEAADGGTLFLDEIGELPLSAQRAYCDLFKT